MEELGKVDIVGKMIYEDGLTAREVASRLDIPLNRAYTYKAHYKKKNGIEEKKKPARYEKIGELHVKYGLTIQEIAEKEGLSTKSVIRYISRYREAYEINRLNEPEIWFKDFREKWDRVRFTLNPNAKIEGSEENG